MLLICTDLDPSDPRHARLDAALQEDHGTRRILASTWAVYTTEPPAVWYKRARTVLGQDHPVLVVAVMSQFAGSLADETLAWLEKHLGTQKP